MLRTLVMLALVPLAGVTGAARTEISLGEFAFTVGLDGHVAACTTAMNDVPHARRLSGIAYASAAWSPDGKRVAVAGGKGFTNPIRVENADGTRLRAVSRPRLATEDDSVPPGRRTERRSCSPATSSLASIRTTAASVSGPSTCAPAASAI